MEFLEKIILLFYFNLLFKHIQNLKKKITLLIKI